MNHYFKIIVPVSFVTSLRAAVALLLLLIIGTVSAATTDAVMVEGAYVRGLPPSVRNTSAYMTLNNISDQALVLIGARTEIAESIGIHRTESSNGMMSMKPVTSLNIPAHGQVVLETGGLHFMLMGLKTPVRPADLLEITLQFEGGLEYSLSLPVRSVLDE